MLLTYERFPAVFIYIFIAVFTFKLRLFFKMTKISFCIMLNYSANKCLAWILYMFFYIKSDVRGMPHIPITLATLHFSASIILLANLGENIFILLVDFSRSNLFPSHFITTLSRHWTQSKDAARNALNFNSSDIHNHTFSSGRYDSNQWLVKLGL